MHFIVSKSRCRSFKIITCCFLICFELFRQIIRFLQYNKSHRVSHVEETKNRAKKFSDRSRSFNTVIKCVSKIVPRISGFFLFFWNFISFIISWSYLSFPKGFFPILKEPLFGKCEIKVYFQHFTQEKCQIENQLNDIFMTKALNKANKLKYAFFKH